MQISRVFSLHSSRLSCTLSFRLFRHLEFQCLSIQITKTTKFCLGPLPCTTLLNMTNGKKNTWLIIGLVSFVSLLFYIRNHSPVQPVVQLKNKKQTPKNCCLVYFVQISFCLCMEGNISSASYIIMAENRNSSD